MNLLYEAVHCQKNQPVFLKGNESKQDRRRLNNLSILQEGKILQSMQGGLGIPHMIWCGQ